MNTVHLNFGRALQFPYESNYSMLRRFVIANSGLTFNSIRNSNNTLKSTKLKSLGDIYTYIDNSRPLTLAKSCLNMYKEFHGNRVGKHCSQCAQMGFHSYLFDCDWIIKCPIHNIVLSDSCPQCDQNWPSAMNLFGRNCNFCGMGLTPIGYEHARNYRNEISMFNEIKYIEKTISNTNIRTSAESGKTASICDFVFNPISPKHVNFIMHSSILGQSNKKWQKEYVRKSNCDYFLKSFAVSKTSIENNVQKEQDIIDFPTWSSKIRFKVLFFIAKSISLCADHKHELFIDDFTGVPPYSLIEPFKFCPYCFSISLWFLLVVSRTTDTYHRHLTSGYSFYLNGMNNTPLAKPIRFIEIDDVTYDMGEPFEIWSYEQTLLLMYLSILRNVIYLMTVPSEVKSFTTFYFQKVVTSNGEQGFHYCSSLDKAMQQFIVTSPDIKQIIQDELVECKPMHQECEKFQEWFDEKRKLTSFVKVENSLQLSAEQIDMMEFGSHKLDLAKRMIDKATLERILRKQNSSLFTEAYERLIKRRKLER